MIDVAEDRDVFQLGAHDIKLRKLRLRQVEERFTHSATVPQTPTTTLPQSTCHSNEPLLAFERLFLPSTCTLGRTCSNKQSMFQQGPRQLQPRETVLRAPLSFGAQRTTSRKRTNETGKHSSQRFPAACTCRTIVVSRYKTYYVLLETSAK